MKLTPLVLLAALAAAPARANGQTVNINVNVQAAQTAQAAPQLLQCVAADGRVFYGYDRAALEGYVYAVNSAYAAQQRTDLFAGFFSAALGPLPGVDYVNTVARFGRPSRRIPLR